MFFYKYNKLDESQIDGLLADRAAPRCASEKSNELCGKNWKILLENGTSLDYEFSADTLTVAENGGEKVECAYTALNMKNIVLCSHLIPGTVRGYQLAADLETGCVTVFKVWFCGYEDKREVQRAIYFGKIEGVHSGEGMHALTNRLEGAGFYWKDDTGVELLTFFPAIIYSTFVEISDPRGGLTISAPSDYVKISDRYFVYSRVEAEYSGTFTMEVYDLFRVEEIGVRLGFDENDTLDYRMYRGTGKITGRAATFSPLTYYGETLSFGEGLKTQLSGEGARPVYRPGKLHPNLTKEQVEEMVKENFAVFSGGSIMKGKNDMDLSDYMVGKSFTLRFDNGGPVWEYEVKDIGNLRWRCEGEKEWHDEIYKGFEPAEDIIMFSHIHTGSPEHRCVSFAADFSTGLVTCVDSHIGNWRTDWEVGNSVIFGVIEAEGIKAPDMRRHAFTTDLVGKSIAWAYSDVMTSVHVYSSPNSYSWTIFLSDYSGGMTWSSPCFYVKLREDAYMFGWVEETCNGNQGLMVFNPRIMHDCGYFYGINEKGLSLTTLGAYARTAGSFDIMPYFENKHK